MRNIYLGDRGVLVQYLQLALTRAGYPVELALQHPEIGEAFRAYLKEFCKTL